MRKITKNFCSYFFPKRHEVSKGIVNIIGPGSGGASQGGVRSQRRGLGAVCIDPTLAYLPLASQAPSKMETKVNKKYIQINKKRTRKSIPKILKTAQAGNF